MINHSIIGKIKNQNCLISAFVNVLWVTATWISVCYVQTRHLKMIDRFINSDINNSRSPIQNKNVCINCSGTFHLVCSLPGNNKPGLRKPNEKHLRHLSEFVSSDPLKPRETSVLIIIYYWIFYPSCRIFFHISCLSVQLTCFPSLRVKLLHVKCTNWTSPSITNTSSSFFQQTSVICVSLLAGLEKFHCDNKDTDRGQTAHHIHLIYDKK